MEKGKLRFAKQLNDPTETASIGGFTPTHEHDSIPNAHFTHALGLARLCYGVMSGIRRGRSRGSANAKSHDVLLGGIPLRCSRPSGIVYNAIPIIAFHNHSFVVMRNPYRSRIPFNQKGPTDSEYSASGGSNEQLILLLGRVDIIEQNETKCLVNRTRSGTTSSRGTTTLGHAVWCLRRSGGP